MPCPAWWIAPLAALAFAAVPGVSARAAQGDAPNAANLKTQQASRSIALANHSGTEITAAHVQTTDGKTWNLAQGGVGSRSGMSIVVPERDCIANVSVTLKGGRRLSADGLHSCNRSEIVVDKYKITIPQIAVPGAKQHGTPG